MAILSPEERIKRIRRQAETMIALCEDVENDTVQLWEVLMLLQAMSRKLTQLTE